MSGFLATTYRSCLVERDPIESEEARQNRELRRKCDRIRLEAAFGFDSELIKRVTRAPA